MRWLPNWTSTRTRPAPKAWKHPKDHWRRKLQLRAPSRLAVGPIFFVGTKWLTPLWTAQASLVSQDHLVDPSLMICLD
ncbi:MAG: hypothetical protein IPP50_18450 [Piscinibacter sp.]|nr:hypothetical protein [Piscinibacter sp.]